ncbi:DUF6455 family protein [Microvirga yunnanensis]|uniref:DUF6455 family protein n=1 Tax=Microvirga yunnanensis TaxID=2953740 RepID=UPI0035A12F54
MGSGSPKEPTLRARSWPRSRWVERQASLFGRMMERVGAQPGATARERFEGGFAAACRRCLACPNATDCGRWLEGGGAGEPPSFCANAAFLNRVRASGTA